MALQKTNSVIVWNLVLELLPSEARSGAFDRQRCAAVTRPDPDFPTVGLCDQPIYKPNLSRDRFFPSIRRDAELTFYFQRIMIIVHG